MLCQEAMTRVHSLDLLSSAQSMRLFSRIFLFARSEVFQHDKLRHTPVLLPPPHVKQAKIWRVRWDLDLNQMLTNAIQVEKQTPRGGAPFFMSPIPNYK